MIRSLLRAGLILLGLSAGAPAAPVDSPWGKDYLPNATLLSQDGQQLRFYDDVIRGKIVVFSFIYTSCRDICPVVTARLAQVEDKLKDVLGRDVFFVSISIDPVTDTPQKLKDYAQAFQTGPGWLFLTGQKDDIDLIRYKLGERSRKVTEHSNMILLFNDNTGEWAKDSAFNDLDTLETTIRGMNPEWRYKDRAAEIAAADPHAAHGVMGHAVELPGQALFIKTCGSCHTVGRGPKVGPDLAGVTTRRDRAWLVEYITGPERMRAKNDGAAIELVKKFPTVRMPNLTLSADDAKDVLAYVEAMTYVRAPRRTAAEEHHHPH